MLPPSVLPPTLPPAMLPPATCLRLRLRLCPISGPSSIDCRRCWGAERCQWTSVGRGAPARAYLGQRGDEAGGKGKAEEHVDCRDKGDNHKDACTQLRRRRRRSAESAGCAGRAQRASTCAYLEKVEQFWLARGRRGALVAACVVRQAAVAAALKLGLHGRASARRRQAYTGRHGHTWTQFLVASGASFHPAETVSVTLSNCK